MNTAFTYEQFIERQKLQTAVTVKHLKFGVWLYFFLLIFEGALRKWFLPALSAPLLVIRDPIALWITLVAINKKLLQVNVYITGIFVLSMISFFTAITIGHGNVVVALYGLRILLIHFPFMFAMGAIFTYEDVEKLGRMMLWMSIPMVLLIGVQFYSPQSAFVNRGIGGDETGAGFSGALGFFRPPGTFSFTNGNALFFGLTSTFIFYYLINNSKINRTVLIASSIALVAAVPLSISRTLTFIIAAGAIFMFIALLRKPQIAGRIVFGIAAVFLVLSIISQFAFFQTATQAFTTRFTSANNNEGGLQGVIADRYFGGMIGAITHSYEIPFFGRGLGMGTNAGSQLLVGKHQFLISEGEWGRLIGEMGLLIGLLVILLRMSFCIQITNLAYKRLAQFDVLPWMMLSFALVNIPQGQWAQPTSLGFSTLSGGLVLAALKGRSNS